MSESDQAPPQLLKPAERGDFGWAAKLIVVPGYDSFPWLEPDENQLGRLSNRMTQMISDRLILNKERYHSLRHAPHDFPVYFLTKDASSERVVYAYIGDIFGMRLL